MIFAWLEIACKQTPERWEQRARKRLIEILARLGQGRGVALLPAFSP
jgi:hypothetical protein